MCVVHGFLGIQALQAHERQLHQQVRHCKGKITSKLIGRASETDNHLHSHNGRGGGSEDDKERKEAELHFERFEVIAWWLIKKVE